jgi:hypothetical protein
MTAFQKIWTGIAFILGAVILSLQFVEAFTRNRVVATDLLALVLLLALGAALWKPATARPPIPLTPWYLYNWPAKLAFSFVAIAFVVTLMCLLALLEVAPDCLGCGPTKTPTPTATFTPSPTPTITPTSTPSPTPTSTPTPTPIIVRLNVFSARYPFVSTGITVNKGDTVEVIAMGGWDCGRHSPVPPDGYYGEYYSDTLFPNAPVCALIGAISSTPLTKDKDFDKYILVGSEQTWKAEDTGKLYLGCNDSKERFSDNPTDSKLEVKIVVSH